MTVVDLPVLVDATSLPPNRGGVARYIVGLLRGLAEDGVAVGVVVKPDDLSWLRSVAPSHRYAVAPAAVARRPVRLLWEQVGLPLLALRARARVLHCPHYTFPLAAGRRSVVTLHDATFFSDPDAHGALKRRFFRLWTRLARRHARATVTPSAATAAEIARFVPHTAVPNVVAHLGVDPAVFHEPTSEAVRSFAAEHDLDTGEGWVAFLGTVEPRKQVAALVAAHAELPDAPPLVVSGGLGWDPTARDLLERAGNRPGARLRHLGFLPNDHLAAFLGGATVVAYPSTGEGFGLPVLEAMACGAAVLTTRRLAIPEVGGDAVAYVEPTADAIAAGLAGLLADPALRSALATDGRQRAQTFTWRACARVHEEVYAA
ncbi:glycosyltransferase family 1 protein [Curtobacterium sp. MCBD17_019]|nr:glycosyltransferase family 1 protein [Curtobacterium sp. MCBD17_019]